MTLHKDDMERAQEIFERMPFKAARLVVDWCKACGVSKEDMLGYDREPTLVLARQRLMWVLHRRMGLSFSQVGRLVNRDRKTVEHGVKAEENRRAESETPPE